MSRQCPRPAIIPTWSPPLPLLATGNPTPRTPDTFPCIVADPPWPVDHPRQRTRGPTPPSTPWKWNAPATPRQIAPLPYPTMPIHEILNLTIPAAEHAHLYLWTINRYIEHAYRIARAWGFRPTTLLTWAKRPMGMGFGGTYANTTEFVLFSRRGTLHATRRECTTWWTWSRPHRPTGGPAHSAKPEEFQTMVERITPGPRLELFARRPRPGWWIWGNEV